MTTTVKPFWSWQCLFAVCLALMGFLQYLMIFSFEMNWDEYLMLDWVYDWREGKTTLPFQTIYLRFFTWLPLISDSEITQIITARLVMLACLVVICASIFGISRRFFSTPAALFAVLAYLSFSFVFRHGTSFRMDIIVTSILMPVLFILTHPKIKKRHVVFCGIAIGLAGMINIKSIFYIPTITVILLARWAFSAWDREAFIQGAVMALIALSSFAGFYLFNLSSLQTSQSGSNYISSVVNISLVEAGLFPSRAYLIFSLKQNPGYWILLGCGIFFAARFLESKDDRLKAVMILSFIIPLMTLVFYLHGFPYYYVFMLAPVSILVAAAFDGLRQSKKMIPLAGLLMIMSANFGTTVKNSLAQTNEYHKQIVQTVHKIFPEPVNFIDRCGMISSFNQTWFFMAHWKMQEYYSTQTPNAYEVLEKDKPAFILANIESLDLSHMDKVDDEKRLLPRDEALLKKHYIRHWGPIYVPGKNLTVSQKPISFEILVAGRYTLEAQSPVSIDNIEYEPGTFLNLKKGTYSIKGPHQMDVTIRFGENLYRPDYKPMGHKVFRGF